MSQPSVVQALASSQVITVKLQPEAMSHASAVQALLSLHIIAGC